MEKLKLVALILMISIGIFNAYSQSNIEYAFSYVIDTRQENNNLKVALEKKLDSIYEKIGEHVIDENDKDFIKNIYIKQKINQKELEISRLKENMDKKKLFNTLLAKDENDTITKMETLRGDIKDIKNKQKELEKYLGTLKKLKANYRKLSEKIDFSNIDTNLLLSEELFLINYISFKKVENYYLFEISSISPEGVEVKKEVFNLSSSVDEIAYKISEYRLNEILGREFIKIRIKVENNMDAKIYINEKFMSKGVYDNDIFDISELETKEINIHINSLNFEDYEKKIPVKNTDTVTLNLTLKNNNKEKILITSNVKSKLYRKAIFLGETPLEIEKPDDSEIILLQAEGHKNNFKLIDNTSSKVNIKMIPDNKSELITSRDKFYVSLGIFTLSTIATIFTGILFNDSIMLYRMAINNYYDGKITINGIYRAKSEEMVSIFLFTTGLTLSITSLIPLIINLVEYIKTASKGE